MRIVKGKITEEAISRLEKSARDYKMPLDVLCDLAMLIHNKGAGVPSSQQLEDFVAEPVNKVSALEGMLLRKRRLYLYNMSNRVLFKLIAHRNGSSLENLELMLMSLARINSRFIQSSCSTCAINASCQFYAKWKETFLNIEQSILSDEQLSLVPSECPYRETIEANCNLEKSMTIIDEAAKLDYATSKLLNMPEPPQSVKELTEEDDPEEGELEGGIAVSNNGGVEISEEDNKYLTNYMRAKGAYNNNGVGASGGVGNIDASNEGWIVKLQNSDLKLFEIALKFEIELNKGLEKEDRKDAQHVSDDKNTRQIERISEASGAVLSEQALPDEVFLDKAVKKELNASKWEEKHKERQLLYILLDVSGSMCATVGAGLRLPAVSLAKILTKALLRRLARKEGFAMSRLFGGKVYNLVIADSKESFQGLEDSISRRLFNDGSTNLPAALEVAIADLKNPPHKNMEKTELLIITDDTEGVPTIQLGRLKQLTKIHALLITQKQQAGWEEHCERLMVIDDSFDGNVEKLVKLVK